MKRLLRVGLVPALVVISAGCASPGAPGPGHSVTPVYDSRFGEAVRLAREQQRRHADPAGRADPLDGIEAAASESVMSRYRGGFQEPARTFESGGIGGS